MQREGVFVLVFAISMVGGAVLLGLRDRKVNTEKSQVEMELTDLPQRAGQDVSLGGKTHEAPHEAKAYCPVERPVAVPEGLKALLRPDNPPQQELILEVLSKLNQEIMTIEKAQVLRWYIHQSSAPDDARNEAVKVLLKWSPTWLPEDLSKMSLDSVQSASWRVYCVQFLQVLFEESRNPGILKAVWLLCDGHDNPVTDQAIYSLACVANQFSWGEVAPGQYAAVGRGIDQSLESNMPSTLIAALRSAAVMRYASAVHKAEKFAMDSAAELKVRVAAVQALAVIARPESVDCLRICAASNKKLLRRYAKIALRNIESVQDSKSQSVLPN